MTELGAFDRKPDSMQNFTPGVKFLGLEASIELNMSGILCSVHFRNSSTDTGSHRSNRICFETYVLCLERYGITICDEDISYMP